MTLSKPAYLPKAPSLNIITLVIKASTSIWRIVPLFSFFSSQLSVEHPPLDISLQSWAKHNCCFLWGFSACSCTFNMTLVN